MQDFDPIKVINAVNSQIDMPDLIEFEFGIKAIEGAEYSISCPLHSDKEPSHRVYPNFRGSYCYSCGKSYTPYSLVKSYYGFDFRETIKHLMDNYKVDLGKVVEASYELDGTVVADILNTLQQFKTVKLTFQISKAINKSFSTGDVRYLNLLQNKVFELYKVNEI